MSWSEFFTGSVSYWLISHCIKNLSQGSVNASADDTVLRMLLIPPGQELGVPGCIWCCRVSMTNAQAGHKKRQEAAHEQTE